MKPPDLITVTPEQVEHGRPCSGDSCPVALAIKAQWGGPVDDIDVDGESVWVWAGDTTYIARIPADAAAFITDFDNLEAPAPVTFALKWDWQEGETI